MSHDPFTVANDQLQRGETLVWAERPGPAARVRAKIMIGFFGVFFFSFSIFWESQAMASGEPFFALFGIPFIVVGAGLVLTPMWAYVEAKRWLYYAITDRRLLIIRLFPFRKVETFNTNLQ